MFGDQEIPMMHFVDPRKFLLFSNRNLSESHKFSPLPMRQYRPPPLSDLSRTEYDPKRYLCIIPCRRAWALISNFHALGAQRTVFFSSSTITRKSSQSQLGVNKCLLLVKKWKGRDAHTFRVTYTARVLGLEINNNRKIIVIQFSQKVCVTEWES